MERHRSSIIILACLVISAVAVFYILWAKKPSTPSSQSSSYPLPVALADQGSSVGAPDGKFTLTMKTQKGQGTNIYTFTMKNETSGTENQIFTNTLPTGSSMSIPQNTFSPDDKYIFLKETDPSGISFIALTSNGSAITKNAQTLDLSAMFAAKYTNYKITDATGWGGMNLIVFNTDNANGSQGPSFWFEVPSGSFIPLSTRFN